jgi:sec-independent protein translocase protein TatA
MFIMFGMPGHWEMIVVLAIAFLIFGPRIPKIARGIGQSITNFRKGLREVDISKEELPDPKA